MKNNNSNSLFCMNSDIHNIHLTNLIDDRRMAENGFDPP